MKQHISLVDSCSPWCLFRFNPHTSSSYKQSMVREMDRVFSHDIPKLLEKASHRSHHPSHAPPAKSKSSWRWWERERDRSALLYLSTCVPICIVEKVNKPLGHITHKRCEAGGRVEDDHFIIIYCIITWIQPTSQQDNKREEGSKQWMWYQSFKISNGLKLKGSGEEQKGTRK